MPDISFRISIISFLNLKSPFTFSVHNVTDDRPQYCVRTYGINCTIVRNIADDKNKWKNSKNVPVDLFMKSYLFSQPRLTEKGKAIVKS